NVGGDAQTVFVRLVDDGRINFRLELGHQPAPAINPDLDHVGLACRHLTNGLTCHLDAVRSGDLGFGNPNNCRGWLTANHTNTLVSAEEVSTRELACVQLRTQLVQQWPIKTEGHDGGDAVGFELLQLLKDGITIVVLGCRFQTEEDAYMSVCRDEPGYNGLTRIVDDLRITGNSCSGGRTDADDVTVADHNRGAVDSGCA